MVNTDGDDPFDWPYGDNQVDDTIPATSIDWGGSDDLPILPLYRAPWLGEDDEDNDDQFNDWGV